MEVTNIRKGFIINIESKRGKPLVSSKGFVNIVKGQYMMCERISIDVLEGNFEWKGK